MTRGILIVGNESTLLAAATNEAAERVESFATAVIPNRFLQPAGASLQKQELHEKTALLKWNPSSPISARSLVLAAENQLKQIDNAVLICSPPALYKAAEILTPEEIEILVNDHVKGWFFLVRELLLYFRRLALGSLSLVAPEGGTSKNTLGMHASIDILGPSALTSFRSFANGVLSSVAAADPFSVMGFTGFEAGTEKEFASWFFKMIDEGDKKNSGRWFKYPKFGFFR